ncbi:MAG: diguanylate cyclase [Deltaproteobacteria bacterium]|nr:diguanylate cyclase [Candidatus Anaeroferrophillus wilburensis]MBN2889614.1 diguanylate cyclase [Deltaproteobacteria bacterium]
MKNQVVDVQLLRLIADTVPCGVVVVSAAGIVELWNRKLQQVTGLAEEEVIAKPWLDVAAEFFVESREQLAPLMAIEGSPDGSKSGRRLTMITPDDGMTAVELLFYPVAPGPEQGMIAGQRLVGIFSWPAGKREGDELSPEAAADGPITGMPNQYELSLMMPQQLALLSRYNIPFSLLFLELKNYQVLLDSLGLESWKATLRVIYGSLQAIIRRADFVGSYDHATFWVLLANASQEGSRRVAEKMIRHASRITVENAQVRLDVVVGGAVARSDEAPQQFFARAQSALQQAVQISEGIVIEE